MFNKSLIKKDLYSYLIYPHFYITGILFFVLTGMRFFIFQNFFIQGQGTSNLTPFFDFIPYISSIFIPVLMISTHKRAPDYHLPFSTLTILASKTVALIAVYFLMCVPLFIIPVFVNIFGTVDAGQAFAGFTGILLYAVLAISFCVFLSELFESKAAFLISSILILIGLNVIHVIPLYANMNDFLNGLIQTVSFIWHFDSFAKGILDTRHILYFLLTAVVFIGLACLVVEISKGRKFGKNQNMAICVLLAVISLLVYLNSSRIYFRFDLTKAKQFSVTKYTKQSLKDINEPLFITYYRSPELMARYPDVGDVYDYLRIFCAENKNIKLKTVGASKEKNSALLSQEGIHSQQIPVISDNKTEYITVYSAIEIEYMGHKKILPFVLNTASLEYELDCRIEELVKGRNLCIYMLVGNEYSSQDYQYAQYLFEASNVNVFILPKNFAETDPSLDITVPLFIFGSSNLSVEDCQFVESFILKGGKAFIATSQYKADINGNWKITKNTEDYLIQLLGYWGIQFEDALVNDISNVTINFVSSKNPNESNSSTEYKNVNYPMWVRVLPQQNAPQGLTLYWPTKLSYSPKVEPLFYSSPSSWTVAELSPNAAAASNELYVTNAFYVEQTPIDDPLFKKEQCALAVRIKGSVTDSNLDESKETEIIVVPDQYFTFNTALELSGGENGDFRNLDYLINCALELNNAAELKNLRYTGTTDTLLYKIDDPQTFANLKTMILIFCLAFVPSLYIIVAVMFFVRRKRLPQISGGKNNE